MDPWPIVLVALVGFAVAVVIVTLALRRKRPGKVERVDKGPAPTPAEAEVDPREKVICASSETIRKVLLVLADMVRHVESAADKSTNRLTDVRKAVGEMQLPRELDEAQQVLLREIDRVAHSNTALRKELNKARETLDEQKQVIENLKTAVRVDALTQLANRQHFNEHLSESIDRFDRYGEPFALMMIDLDHFKSINDTYGHLAGDRILKAMALKLKAGVRMSDFVARYGGEEFAIVVVKAAPELAFKIAEDTRDAVETSSFNLEGKILHVTVSIGIASVCKGDTPDTVIRRADQAMYYAKRTGRNRVCVYEELEREGRLGGQTR